MATADEVLAGMAVNLRGASSALAEWADALDAIGAPDDAPAMTLYSMRDRRWRDQVYAGGVTFGEAGCYITCVAMIASIAGVVDEPPEVAWRLRKALCFDGAYLTRPQNIPIEYPYLRYDGPMDVTHDGELRWHDCIADIGRVRAELEDGPVIMEVDFIPVTKGFNQHFVVAEAMTPDGDDILIADPWDGSCTRLLERYALPEHEWKLARAVYGLRLLRVAG